MKKQFFGTFILTLCFLQQTLAREITFGPEFEFSHPRMHWIDNPIEMIKTGYNYPGAREQVELKRFADAVKKKCKVYQCKVEEVPGKWDEKGAKTYKVSFADGWFFSITPDAWVVEITAAPLTLSELKSKKNMLDEMIFNTAKEIDLDSRGSDVVGGLFGKAAGHVNFGTRSAFGEDGKEWLRYFVDYANFPELAAGAMQKDIINAPSFAKLGPGPRQALDKIVMDINARNNLSPSEVAGRVLKEVYTTSPVMKSEANHYQAVGIKHVAKMKEDGDLPTEHRAVMSQRNTEEFILMAELITARVAWLKEQGNSPIVLAPFSVASYSKKELISAFYLYVTEVGMDFEKYRALLRPELQLAELDLFVRGLRPKTAAEHSDFADSVRWSLSKLTSSEIVKKRMKWILTDSQLMEYRPWVIDLILQQAKQNLETEYGKALVDFMYELKAENRMYRHLLLPERQVQKAIRCESLI